MFIDDSGREMSCGAGYTGTVTPHQQDLLHQFYINARALMAAGIVPAINVQRSFDEVLGGVRGPESWRPTHVSPAAAEELPRSATKRVQRAHGVLAGRMDRYDRTLLLLRGDERPFAEWWEFWCEHDATVLVTREEHGAGRIFQEDELIPVPEGMFRSAGFAFKVRKKVEVAWLLGLAAKDG